MAISLLVVLLLCTVGINSQEHSPQYWDDYVNGHLSEGVTKFAIDLNRILDAKKGGENVAFSPMNIVGLLAVLLLGSVGKSNETLSALGFDKDDVVSGDTEFLHQMFGNLTKSIQFPNNTVKVESINSIFVQEGYSIRPNFAAFARDVYKYDIGDVNFSQDPLAAQNTINNWIKSATHGKIDRLLEEPLDSATRIFLASTLNLKEEWHHTFQEEKTRRKPFYLDSGEIVGVDMMEGYGDWLHHSNDELEIIGIPYTYNRGILSSFDSTMYVVLPHPSVNLSVLVSHLTPDYISSLIDKTRLRRCVLRLPKMKISSEFTLHDTLQSLGFITMFDSKLANFGLLSTGEAGPSSMDEGLNFPKTKSDIKGGNNEKDRNSSTPVDFEQYVNDKEFPSYGLDELRRSRNFSNPELYVAQGQHKVIIEITEGGTEASASSGVNLLLRASSPPILVNVIRPFLFFVKHEPSGLISLWGAVRKPTPFYKATQDIINYKYENSIPSRHPFGRRPLPLPLLSLPTARTMHAKN